MIWSENETSFFYMRFLDLTVATMFMLVSWVVTLSEFLGSSQHFRETQCLLLQGFIENNYCSVFCFCFYQLVYIIV